MFRQIKVHEEDVDWQRILWRDSPTETIKEYRLTTVTYEGSHSTSVRAAGDDEKKGGFSLRKWVSNDPDVLATIPEELKAVDSKHTIKDDQPVKILGIAWLPDVDKAPPLTITVNESDVWTKRKVLSEVAKIFDPLGWLVPSVIISKIFLQELWSHHLNWDEELPDSQARQWRIFVRTASCTYGYQDPTLLIPQACIYKYTCGSVTLQKRPTVQLYTFIVPRMQPKPVFLDSANF
ncbi:integrase catalytic domain-containing protein [Trichonephila inaurata madagascariensis]|uniref:Integrase catalytic domain-containing protein n=1 Tax=Trichonephila inaurata madagascariensis TaxID=2747483 RepID=A0A8X6WU83_9ARAC|nr:integrase catalytic domain-containing protein [Trichonephila inaurata madagascariensis]